MAIANPIITAEEIGRRGQALYEADIRAKVETPENIGKVIAIDIFSGDYEVGDREMDAYDRVEAGHTGCLCYFVRIGFDYVTSIGGSSLGLLA